MLTVFSKYLFPTPTLAFRQFCPFIIPNQRFFYRCLNPNLRNSSFFKWTLPSSARCLHCQDKDDGIYLKGELKQQHGFLLQSLGHSFQWQCNFYLKMACGDKNIFLQFTHLRVLRFILFQANIVKNILQLDLKPTKPALRKEVRVKHKPSRMAVIVQPILLQLGQSRTQYQSTHIAIIPLNSPSASDFQSWDVLGGWCICISHSLWISMMGIHAVTFWNHAELYHRHCSISVSF